MLKKKLNEIKVVMDVQMDNENELFFSVGRQFVGKYYCILDFWHYMYIELQQHLNVNLNVNFSFYLKFI